MGIEVVPYTEDRVPDVAAFNRRMHDGGSHWGWYEGSEDPWLPKRPGIKVWREHFLAVEDQGPVRGAYALKPHEWQVQGEPLLVTDWQGPVSEGVLTRKYNTLGLRLIRDMLKRYPLLYSWGHGGDEAAMLQMLRALKWRIHGTPFCLKVLKPFRFLRRNAYLRGTSARRIGLDALAWSGAGWLGLQALHRGLAVRGLGVASLETQVVDEFGSWADGIWESCRRSYSVIGLRDAATMNALLPQSGWPECTRIKMSRDGHVVGWAVIRDHQVRDDPRFGDLRVGSVIDCLAQPEDAPAVIRAATRILATRGVDMIGSNQSHPSWTDAFARSGFALIPERRYFAMSPELGKALEPFDRVQQGLHLTNMDGHGPHGF
jgi:hypothetical protein